MTHPSFKTNYVERVCLGDATSMSNQQLKTKEEIKRPGRANLSTRRQLRNKQQEKPRVKKKKAFKAYYIMNYICACQSQRRGHLKRQCQKRLLLTCKNTFDICS